MTSIDKVIKIISETPDGNGLGVVDNSLCALAFGAYSGLIGFGTYQLVTQPQFADANLLEKGIVGGLAYLGLLTIAATIGFIKEAGIELYKDRLPY